MSNVDECSRLHESEGVLRYKRSINEKLCFFSEILTRTYVKLQQAYISEAVVSFPKKRADAKTFYLAM